MKKVISAIFAVVMLVSVCPAGVFAAGESENLLQNPGFESGISPWGFNDIFTLSNEDAHTGAYSVKVDGLGNFQGMRQDIDVKPNTDYVMTFYSKVQGLLYPRVLTVPNEATIADGGSIPTSLTWIKNTINFNSGDRTKVRIAVLHYNGLGYLDDFSVVEKSAPEEAELKGEPADFSDRDTLNVCYLGGSITQGAGATDYNNTWVAQTGRYIKELYPDKTVNIYNAGVGGTGSNLGIFRLYNDVIVHDPDIVFIEFAVNDSITNPDTVKLNMEGIVRQLLKLPKKVAIIFIYTTSENYSACTQTHQEVANYYGIPSINIQDYIKKEITEGRLTWAEIGADNTHPNDKGYDIYAKYIISKLEENHDKYFRFLPLPDEPMSGYEFHSPRLVNADSATLGSGWSAVSSGIFSNAIRSSAAGAEATFNFKGRSFGLYYALASGSAGVDCYIDDISYGTVYVGFGAPYTVVTNYLLEGNHTVRIVTKDSVPVTIGYFMIDDNSEIIIPGESGTEFKNPGFEGGKTDWTFGTHWEISEDRPHSGNRCAKLVYTSENDYCHLYQIVNLKKNTNYVIQYYSRSDANWGAQLKRINPENNETIEFYGISASTNWSHNAIEFNSGNYTRMKFAFQDVNSNTFIDDVCIKEKGEPPKVLKTACTPADNAVEVLVDSPITVQFDEEVRTSTVSGNTLKLVRADSGTEVACTVTKVNELTYRLTPNQPLSRNTKYEVVVGPGIQDTFGNEMIEAATLAFTTAHNDFDLWEGTITDLSGGKIDDFQDVLGVKASCILKNNTGESKTASVLLGLFAGNTLKKLAYSSGTVAADGEPHTITVEISPIPEGITNARVFIWDSVDTMIPISSPVELRPEPASPPTVADSTVGIHSCKINKVTNEVMIEGCIGAEYANEQATLLVMKPGQELDAVPNPQSVDLSDKVDMVAQAVTGEGGAFLFKYMLTEYDGVVNDPTYRVKVMAAGIEQPFAGEFKYFPSALVQKAVSDVINASDSAIRSVMEQYSDLFGLDTGVYNTLNKDGVAGIFCKRKSEISEAGTFAQQAEKITELFNYALAVQSVNEAVDATSLRRLLTKYDSVFALSQAAGYKTYSSNSMPSTFQNTVLDAMLGGQYDSSAAWLEAFNMKVFLLGLRCIPNKLYVKTILADNYGYLTEKSTSFAGYYTKYMNMSDKSYVDNALAGNDFTLDFFYTAFYNAVDNTPRDGGNNPVRNGGPRGGSSPVKYSSDMQSQENENTPQTATQPGRTKIFPDLPDSSWAAEGVRYLSRQGIVSGTEQGLFLPENYITREEFLKLVLLSFKLEQANAKCDFTDVTADAWYYPYAASAQAFGITNGIGDGRFGAGLAITRQDMAQMIYKCVQKAGMKLSEVNAPLAFTDADSIAPYAAEAVTGMQKAGIINGFEDGSFRPKECATRAQAAVMIYRIIAVLREDK